MSGQKKILSSHERRIITAFAEVLLPLKPEDQLTLPLIMKIEGHLGSIGSDMRFLWRGCLWMIEIAAFFYAGKFRFMTGMAVPLREKYWLAWHRNRFFPVRTIKHFLESIVFMNYYSLPEVEKGIGHTHAFAPAGPAMEIPLAQMICPPVANDIQCEADVCIVGSGAGGAFAAMALAEKGRRVVIIEEGDYFDVASFGKDAMTMTQTLYRDGGLTNTFGFPPIVVPLGCAVGGTTVINSGTCFRTPPKVFNWWADRFGLSNWLPEKLDSYYEQVEKLLDIETARDEVQSASGKIFARGAEGLGFDVKPLVRNAKGCKGSGVCCFGCPTNAKKAVSMNAIPLALKAGAAIYTSCRAEKILFDGRRVRGVVARFKGLDSRARGACLTVKARAVVVACGTLPTPVLLGRSKIPNPSGQRGHNLTLHPASKIYALFDEEVCGFNGIPQGYFSDSFAEEGIKLEGIFLPPAFTASTILLSGREHREVMEQYRNLAAFGMMVSDVSRGRVIRTVGGHFIALYSVGREDLPKYQRGLTHLAQGFFEAGAKRVFLPIHTLPVVTREEGAGVIAKLKLASRDLDLQAFHPLGTCRMGADPRESVLDPYARVYGLENLFVADGSIFPTSLGVNPQLTIMAAALKIADYVDREYL